MGLYLLFCQAIGNLPNFRVQITRGVDEPREQAFARDAIQSDQRLEAQFWGGIRVRRLEHLQDLRVAAIADVGDLAQRGERHLAHLHGRVARGIEQGLARLFGVRIPQSQGRCRSDMQIRITGEHVT